jgi:putative transposase
VSLFPKIAPIATRISILVEDDIAHLPVIEQAIGADLGLKSFVALSTGEIVGNPKFFHKDEKKLAKAQRRHAKKKKGSKNRDKARLKVARIHARIADRRRDAPAETFDPTHTREPSRVC